MRLHRSVKVGCAHHGVSFRCRHVECFGSSGWIGSDRIASACVRACVRRRVGMSFDLIFFIVDLIRSTSSSVSRARSFKRNAPRRRNERREKTPRVRTTDRTNEPGGHGIDACVRPNERTNERTNGISFVEIDHSSVYDVRFRKRGARAIADAREEGSRVVLPV